jgi:hypothetical protein
LLRLKELLPRSMLIIYFSLVGFLDKSFIITHWRLKGFMAQGIPVDLPEIKIK